MARFIDTRDASNYQIDQLCVEMAGVDGFTRIMTGIDDELGHTVLEIIFDFDEELTQQQIDDATAIIDAHVPGALNVKVINYSATTVYNMLEVPLELDYVNGLSVSLFRSIDEIYHEVPPLLGIEGMPKTVIWYAEASQDEETFATTYDDPVIIERYTYAVDALGDVRAETKVISWVLESGAEHEQTKTVTTYY